MDRKNRPEARYLTSLHPLSDPFGWPAPREESLDGWVGKHDRDAKRLRREARKAKYWNGGSR